MALYSVGFEGDMLIVNKDFEDLEGGDREKTALLIAELNLVLMDLTLIYEKNCHNKN